MEFIDFPALARGQALDLIFPGWAEGERVAFYSPHDDDAALGAGYLIQAVLAQGGRPFVLVFCRGDAGYSAVEDKPSIVALRKNETLRAYAELGVAGADILHLGAPDFGLMPSVGRTEGRKKGLFDELVAFLRKEKITRVVFTSGNFEHWDHTAVFYEGVYTSPQAGDPILADLGPPSPIRSYAAYSVWGDFEPAGEGAARGLRADKGILAEPAEEDKIQRALQAFHSQDRIMHQTVAARRTRRRTDEGYLELYKTVRIRASIDYRPYASVLKNCRRV
jgi:LmbE family N-acetylglucosaminyl deacetylase